MIFPLIATEDKSGAFSLLRALEDIRSRSLVRSFSLEGNQGHLKAIIKAEQGYQECILELEELGILDEDSKIEKWLVLDDDKMSEAGITESDLYSSAKKFGIKIAICRPNFEGEVLQILKGKSYANGIKPCNLMTEIEKARCEINAKLEEALEEPLNDAAKLSRYNKRQDAGYIFLYRLLDLHPELVRRFLDENQPIGEGVYTLADVVRVFMV